MRGRAKAETSSLLDGLEERIVRSWQGCSLANPSGSSLSDLSLSYSPSFLCWHISVPVLALSFLLKSHLMSGLGEHE